MKIIKSLTLAFSMFSAIPVPQAEWDEDNMKYMLCFFPLIGAVIGALLILWVRVATIYLYGAALYAGVCVLIPAAVSGAIHLDGFCDTVDALSSRKDKEQKLQILKDPHTGAFAVIGCVLYLLMLFCLWAELIPSKEATLILALGFILSRTLSGLSLMFFRRAKPDGLAASFSKSAAETRVKTVLILFLIVCSALMLVIEPFTGVLCLSTAALVFVYYFRMSNRQFGGVTGDLAGYFLQLCELFLLLAVLVAQKFIY